MKVKNLLTLAVALLCAGSTWAEDYPQDMTSYIKNPEINGANGWTTEKPGGGNGPLLGDSSFEYWNETAANGAFDYYQVITGLPNGKYTVSAEMYNSTNGVQGAIFSATSGVYATNNKDVTVYKLVDVDGEQLLRYTTDVISVANGTLRIGVKNVTKMTARWFVADNFKLTLVADLDLAEYIEGYQNALTVANSIIDADEKMAPSIKAALQAAISAEVDDTNLAAVKNALTTLQTAINNANTSVASYKIIASGEVPTDKLDGWSTTNTNLLQVNTWSNEGENDGTGMVKPFIENWVNQASTLGEGTVSYTLAGLEQGEVYYAQALVRAYSEAGNIPNGPDFFVNNVASKMSDVGQPFEYNGMKGYYGTLGSTATVGEDGKIILGVEIAKGANYNWVAFKNVSIVLMNDAYDDAVKQAENLQGQIPAAAYAQLQAVLEENSDISEKSIQAITAATETAKSLVQPYAKFNENKAYANELLEADYKDVVEGAHATYETAFNAAVSEVENQTTVDGIKNVLQTLKTVGATYNNNAEPTNAEKPFNLTFLFENPNLEGLPTWQPADGWYTEQTDGNSQVMTNEKITSENGQYTAVYEYWSATNNLKTNNKFTLYQKTTLPAGTYDMSCYAFAQDENADAAHTKQVGVYFYANETQGSAVSSPRLTQQTLSFVQSEEGEVKVGLKAVAGNTYNWMGIGYVELYRVPAKAYEVDENAKVANVDGAGTVTLKRTIKEGYNTLVLPFSMTQAEVEEHFGDGAVVYEVTKYENDNISFSSREGIAPNTPCVLKATKAGTEYEIEARTLVAADALEQNGTDAKLVGTYEPDYTVEQNAANYIISNNGLYLVNSAVTLKSTRAYIHLTEAEPAEVAARLTMTFDGGEATGIEALEEAGVEILSGAIYNVQGQRLNSLQKGINIVGGKKILVK